MFGQVFSGLQGVIGTAVVSSGVAGRSEGFWHDLAQFGTFLACFPQKQPELNWSASVAEVSQGLHKGPRKTPFFVRGGRGGARRTS